MISEGRFNIKSSGNTLTNFAKHQAEESHFHLHMDTSHLLYLIIKARRVDVARTIANEMKILVESGEEPGTGAKVIHPLVIPGLIMGLIRVAHIVIPNHVHNKII